MFTSLLVANRGEIACRIFRTARAMGIKTIAVYSDADAKAKHVREADVAIHIGASPAAESYLSIARVLEAAKKSGAQAIHPGYGFLSENPGFAEAVIKAGLIWVGPTPASIRAMGLKDEAKRIAEEAGAPVVPGYRGADQSEAVLLDAAKDIGFPVLIKAVAGGGGRGIREATGASDFSVALAAARREAKAAFGDDRVLIEKLIAKPRHIEVQVFGDKHGGLVHLFERDCSLQRRRQKVIEEAPAPGMTEEVRAVMTAAALKIARAVNYENAGTVEFIVEGAPRADNFYFMEMNTRLQVEHPVTEAITGLDLVEWQLLVAAGEELPFAQDEIKMQGHAVEARLCAEDPSHDFRPSIGRIERLWGRKRNGPQARIDSGFDIGDEISPHYDSLIAKVISFAGDRRRAWFNAGVPLNYLEAIGIATNAGMLGNALLFLGDEDGPYELSTNAFADYPELLKPIERFTPKIIVAAAAAAIWFDRSASRDASPWATGDGWRLNSAPRDQIRLRYGGLHVIDATPSEYFIDLDVAGTRIRVRRNYLERVGDVISVVADTSRAEHFAGHGLVTPEKCYLFDSGWTVEVDRETGNQTDIAAIAGGDTILAPLPGKLVSVTAMPGARVKRGDVLALLEAMKMEHALAAPRDGVVEEVAAKAGAQVKQRDLIVRLKAEPA